MSDFWNINVDDKLRHIHSYQSGHWLSLPWLSVVFFSLSRQKTTQCIEFSHERFLTHVFYSIITASFDTLQPELLIQQVNVP